MARFPACKCFDACKTDVALHRAAGHGTVRTLQCTAGQLGVSCRCAVWSGHDGLKDGNDGCWSAVGQAAVRGGREMKSAQTEALATRSWTRPGAWRA